MQERSSLIDIDVQVVTLVLGGKENAQRGSVFGRRKPAGVTMRQNSIDAIEQAGDLGAGFTLATHDLEIRGAGELLGDEQSGQIQNVGFSLYMEMLDRAVRALQNGEQIDLETPANIGGEINLRVPALIPDAYLPDVHSRLILYKRISSVESDDDVISLREEMIDRFVKNANKEISIDYIQKVICNYFNLTLESLKSKTRKRNIVQARQLSMYFAKKLTKHSLAYIGAQSGGKDHATVLHACKTVGNLSDTDKNFRVYVDDLNKKFQMN